MSDGISQAYRDASDSQIFRNKWEKAQVEELLLTDLRKELEPLSLAELMLKAYQESRDLRLDEERGWMVEYNWGKSFQTSIASSEADRWPRAVRFKVCVGNNSFGIFYDYDQREALIDGILYTRWLSSPEGQKAYEIYCR